MRTTPYPQDQAEIEALGASRQDFETWMALLEHEHQAAGCPYGSPGEDIWDATGPACWIPYFKEGTSPAAALSEDLSSG